MTKITRAPCRRRIGGAVPRGDLITADHKVLSEKLCISKQSSICNRGAGLSHPMDPVVSVRNKNSLRKHQGACKSPWSQIGNLKSFTLDNSLEFGKACEDLSWNHCTSTPHRSETNGIAERAVRRVKEGTSSVLLQSGLNENWRFHGMLHLSEEHTRSRV